MNQVVLLGRLTAEPDIRESQDGLKIARYTIAVDRFKADEADFIRCVQFGKGAEFAEKWYHKGTKIALTGRIQTGSYTNQEGRKVYTTEVIVDHTEFAESKRAAEEQETAVEETDEDFMDIPDNIDEELPFA